MRQMEVTEKQIGDAVFYIKPFAAFTAANISGELASILVPMVASVAALIDTGKVKEGQKKDIEDIDIDDALPAVTKAFSNVSGDDFERLMKKLLIDSKNISVESEATGGDVKLLTYDLANEVFCGEVQDMYVLCFEVIRLNFNGFFKKFAGRFGSLRTIMEKPEKNSMANLT